MELTREERENSSRERREEGKDGELEKTGGREKGRIREE